MLALLVSASMTNSHMEPVLTRSGAMVNIMCTIWSDFEHVYVTFEVMKCRLLFYFVLILLAWSLWPWLSVAAAFITFTCFTIRDFLLNFIFFYK